MTLQMNGLNYFNAFLGLFFWSLGPMDLVMCNARIQFTDTKLV